MLFRRELGWLTALTDLELETNKLTGERHCWFYFQGGTSIFVLVDAGVSHRRYSLCSQMIPVTFAGFRCLCHRVQVQQVLANELFA